ncbi:hypothetical protein CALCODRAFT_81048 [Calocera cornea HHB12733]|uniref:Uncharacterized protein n=1 Tax=Calocera cornea HHB12733 TaxID=1353952 RepID=A0A165DEE9_9BASI|nr:hypothetical protein CALCODRAFT_81048 [Calocera cornea HHB12733]
MRLLENHSGGSTKRHMGNVPAFSQSIMLTILPASGPDGHTRIFLSQDQPCTFPACSQIANLPCKSTCHRQKVLDRPPLCATCGINRSIPSKAALAAMCFWRVSSSGRDLLFRRSGYCSSRSLFSLSEVSSHSRTDLNERLARLLVAKVRLASAWLRAADSATTLDI